MVPPSNQHRASALSKDSSILLQSFGFNLKCGLFPMPVFGRSKRRLDDWRLFRSLSRVPTLTYVIWFLGETFRTIGIGLVMFVRSFGTKSAPRISRKQFGLESPNFTGIQGYPYRHCLQNYQIWRHCLLSVERYSEKLSKMPLPTAAGGISRERFKLGPQNFKHLSRTVGPTGLPEMT